MDKELIAIVNEAIPLDPKCEVNRKRDIIKRLWLIEKIKEYSSKQLSQQFNAKPEMWEGVNIDTSINAREW